MCALRTPDVCTEHVQFLPEKRGAASSEVTGEDRWSVVKTWKGRSGKTGKWAVSTELAHRGLRKTLFRRSKSDLT